MRAAERALARIAADGASSVSGWAIWLPLAGSDVTQLGVCLGLALVICEVVASLKR